MSEWISTADRMPATHEPIVYCRPHRQTGEWHVGVAYWTVSQRWLPEAQSSREPHGFTHWMPLPEPPT